MERQSEPGSAPRSVPNLPPPFLASMLSPDPPSQSWNGWPGPRPTHRLGREKGRDSFRTHSDASAPSSWDPSLSCVSVLPP